MLGTPLRRCSATGSRRTRRAWAEREPSGQADLFGGPQQIGDAPWVVEADLVLGITV